MNLEWQCTHSCAYMTINFKCVFHNLNLSTPVSNTFDYMQVLSMIFTLLESFIIYLLSNGMTTLGN